MAWPLIIGLYLGCGGDDAPTDVSAADGADTAPPDGTPPDTAPPDTTPSDSAPTDTNPDDCFPLAGGPCVRETFKNPPLFEPDADGVYELELTPTEFTFEGQRHCGRGYNGLYPPPTLVTPARDGDTPRQVRVNLRNRFTRSSVRDLHGQVCECLDRTTGQSCDPSATSHGGHGADQGCHCTNAAGEPCHMFDFNVTNLHAHGSHVRPDYAAGGGCVEGDGLRCRSCSGDRGAAPRECYLADDVISRVGPGEGVQHRWDIDEDGTHHEGLQWYHPHVHGSTAIQVASGATGAWIVRGPLDALPGIQGARERILLIMTPPSGFEPLAEGEPCDEDHLTFDHFPVLTGVSERQVNLINGVRRPRMIMAPGQIERWRFLHGSFLDEIFIALFRGLDPDCRSLDFEAGPVPLTQIARDGLVMPKPPDGRDWPFAPPYLFMSPGYRIEALLDGGAFTDGDTLCLMAGRFLQADDDGVTDGDVGIREPSTRDDILRKVGNGDLIGIVNVTASAGAPTQTRMPDLTAVAALAPSLKLQGGTVDALEKCAEVEAITDPSAIDQLAVFWMIFFTGDTYDNCGCKDHNINCRNFETTDRAARPYDRVLTLGALDHWRVHAGFDGHPFHIHINPYVVCPLPPEGSPHRNATARLFEPPFAHWRDTYLVNLDRAHDLLTEYRAFTGEYVQHCHKLTHEDEGMMELLRVCDPKVEDCDLCDGRPCTWNSCPEGDTNCLREVASSECIADPARCPEALLRCSPCDAADDRCLPGSHCGDAVAQDGLTRCVPGCVVDQDCLPVEACGAEGQCQPAPPCVPPCGPGSACLHGTCR